MPDGGPESHGGALRYFAFISYSHKDADEGRRIHRALESYRMPPRLVGSNTAYGPLAARLFPIFRDREELSAGEDLSAQVQNALTQSRALIVLCSPDAAQSPWVGKEIETFRALFPDRPIFAALIKGEPETAFHPALIDGGKREPVAADFRKGKDGRRLAQLKLIAGLTGAGLDTLVQRDAQRQVRRVTVITLAAGFAVLAMALLLILALRSQAEAERQRSEAEGLVEYMLTDLRDRLKGVGRLDVMTAVNERAMGFYTKQGDLSRLPDASLERRARVLHAMGEDDEKRGDLPKAQLKFEEAHRTTAAVLAKKPNDPDAIFAHAQSEYWVGYVHQTRGQHSEALRLYQQEADRLEALLKVQPEHEGAKDWLAWAHNAMGVVQLNGLKDAAKAKTHFERTLAIFDAKNKAKPGDAAILYNLADAHAWVADAYFAEKSDAKARFHREQQAAILDELLKADPTNQQYRWPRIGTDRALFKICLRAKDYECAEKAIARADSRLGSAPVDSANSDWLWMKASLAVDESQMALVGRSCAAATDAGRMLKERINEYLENFLKMNSMGIDFKNFEKRFFSNLKTRCQ